MNLTGPFDQLIPGFRRVGRVQTGFFHKLFIHEQNLRTCIPWKRKGLTVKHGRVIDAFKIRTCFILSKIIRKIQQSTFASQLARELCVQIYYIGAFAAGCTRQQTL
ncbi:hypothetical protein D3C75_750430 [compost metagenome]